MKPHRSIAFSTLLVLTVASLPAWALSDSRSQIVEGEILMADPTPDRYGRCDGPIPGQIDNRVRDPVRRAGSGTSWYQFDVEPHTVNHPFLLDALASPDADLDILFINEEEGVVRSSTRDTSIERGMVPEDAVRGYVCLSGGSQASFRYEAGPDVPPPPLVAESELADHSANLRLLAHSEAEGLRRLVFQGNRAVASSRYGIYIYRLLKRAPYIEQISFYECRGGTVSSDISVWGKYIFQSIPDEFPYFPNADLEYDYNTTESETCNNTDDSLKKGGIRVIDISDPTRPTQVKFFEFPCGSMNHTLVPNGEKLYIYAPIPCDEDAPSLPEQLPSRLRSIRPLTFQIHVLEFDVDDPQRSKPAGTPQLDEPGGQWGCHDITVFPARDVAACPQFFNAVLKTSLLDISDPANPKAISHFELPAQSSWMAHAAFTWDGDYLLLADTGRAGYTLMDDLNQCSEEGNEERIASVWVYDVSNKRKPIYVSNYSLRRNGYDTEGPCSPWEINMVPTVDMARRLAVVGWMSGGMTLIDLSKSSHPEEIGYWQPGSPPTDIMGAYFYNGRIYAADLHTGLRVFELDGFGSKTTKSYAVRMNAQTQLLEFRN